MKILSRDFTLQERILILVLCLVLVGLAYYQFVDQPVRRDIAAAKSEKEALELELTTVNAKVAQLEKMKQELESLDASGTTSTMPSYNNSKAELALLNDILANKNYNVTFANVTRNGDQIRRSFTLNFSVSNFNDAQKVLTELANSPYRCLLNDLRCSMSPRERYVNADGTYSYRRTISVSTTATFYETMVGGTVDAGLPADKSAAN